MIPTRPAIPLIIPMYFLEAWSIVEDPKVATSIKCQYQDQLYSLGAPQPSFPALLSLITTSIPYLQLSHFSVLYKDPDGDLVEITTTESLVEAYQLCPGLMKLYVSKTAAYQEPIQAVALDSTLDFALIFARLSAVFTISLGNKAVGMGIAIEGNLAVTTAPALQQMDAAAHASALFHIPGFGQAFDPTVRYIREGPLTLLAFKSTLPAEVRPLTFRNDTPKRGTIALILHQPVDNDPKAALKWVEIKDSTTEAFHYDSKEPCGPAGAPVFNEAMDLIGIQFTECVQSNRAIPGVTVGQSVAKVFAGVIEVLDES